MTQIVRLFLEANLRKIKTFASQASTFKISQQQQHDKTPHTPAHTVANSNNTNESVDSSSSKDDSSIIDQDSPIDLLQHQNDSPTDISKESTVNNSSPTKLRRSPEFKIKKPSSSAFHNHHDTPLGVTSLVPGHVQKKDGFYHQHNDYHGNDDEVFTSQDDETGYVSLQEEHSMLQQMYTKAIQENERLKDANGFMQQKLSSLVNLKHKEVFGSSFSSGNGCINPELLEKQDMFNKIYYEDMSFDQLNDLTNNSFEISTGQQSIYNQAKDLSTLQRNKNLLEAENLTLMRERNESRERLKDLEDLIQEHAEKVRNLEAHVKTIENSNSTLVDQVVYLCSTLEVVKHMEATHRLPANKDELSILESELYMMIDQNVRYESALMEIKFKVTKYKEKVSIETPDSRLSSPNSPSTTPDSASKSGRNNSKVKRSISARASSSRSSSPLVRKASEIKKERRESVKTLRRDNNDRSATLAKEIKTCRATRIKELLQERLLMTQRITTLEKDIVAKDEELEKKNLHVELLTREVGKIDLESMGVGGVGADDSSTSILSNKERKLERDSTFVKEEDKEGQQSGVVKARHGTNCVDISLPLGENEDIEIIEIPEVKYDDLMAFVQSKRNNEVSSPLGPGIDSFERTKNKTRLIEREFKTQIVSLERSNECLRESNCALSEELYHIKSMSRDQKEKIKTLKMDVARITSEADALKYQLKLSQSGFENSRLKYEKQISMIRKQMAIANQDHQIVSVTSTKKRLKNVPLLQGSG